MGLSSTLIYTSELILCFTICVLSATRHNILEPLSPLLYLDIYLVQNNRSFPFSRLLFTSRGFPPWHLAQSPALFYHAEPPLGIIRDFKDVRAKIFQHWFFSETFTTLSWWDTYVRNVKKNKGSPTSFRREQALKIILNLKNRVSSTNKATMSGSPKIMQLNLKSDMFSAKYCSSRPTKWN